MPSLANLVYQTRAIGEMFPILGNGGFSGLEPCLAWAEFSAAWLPHLDSFVLI